MAAKRLKEAMVDQGPRDKNGPLEVPQHLIDSISAGQCVAFVGAGFSAAAKLPGWATLLEAILAKGCEEKAIPDCKREAIQAMIDQGTSSSFDTAAQVMEDCGAPVAKVCQEQLKPPAEDELPPAMKLRLKLLRSIPFNAIVTTNFDYFLSGPPGAHDDAKEMMRAILRTNPPTLVEQMHRIWASTMDSDSDKLVKKFKEHRDAFAPECEDMGEGEHVTKEIKFMSPPGMERTPIIQLHGTVAQDCYLGDPGLAFSRRGYRQLLHGNSQYQSFLASLMASKTILYIGYSLSDEYINEMRSKTMMMLEKTRPAASVEGAQSEEPIAYAIMLNETSTKIEHFAKNEGINILNYVPSEGPGFEGVEAWLHAIHLKTHPLYRWSQCLIGKTFLLCGKHQVLAGFQCMLEYVQDEFCISSGGTAVVPMPGKDECCSSHYFLEACKKHGKVDLIVVPWKSNGHHTAKYVLQAQAALEIDQRSPVLVVDSVSQGADDIKIQSVTLERKKESIKMGAAGFVYSFSSLLSEMDHVLKDPVRVREERCSIQ